MSALASGGVRPRTALPMEMAVESPLTSESATALAPEMTVETPGRTIRWRWRDLLGAAPWKLSSVANYVHCTVYARIHKS